MATVFKTFEEQLAESYPAAQPSGGSGNPSTSQLQPLGTGGSAVLPSPAPSAQAQSSSPAPAGPTQTQPAPGPQSLAPASLPPPGGRPPAATAIRPLGSPAAAPAPAPKVQSSSPAPAAPSAGAQVAYSVAPPAQPAPAAAPATSVAPPVAAASKPVIQVRQYTPPAAAEDPYAALFQNFRQGLSKAGTQLQGAANTFTEAAGPNRDWAGVGGEAAIQAAMHPTADSDSDARAVAAAKALLASQYAGPQDLAPEDLATLEEAQAELQGRARSLRGSAGVEDLVAGHTTGLTPGELAFESARMRADPRFRQAAGEAELGSARLGADIGSAESQAQKIAADRAAQEADIASRASGLLTGERGKISSDLAAKVAAEEAKNKAAADAYAKWKETGSLEDLSAVPGGAPAAGAFNTPTMKLTAEAQAKRSAILGKYSDLQDVPLLTLQTTSKGRETLGFPPEWYQAAKETHSKAELNQIRDRAMARQKELEAAGFASKSSNAGAFTGAVGTGVVPGTAGTSFKGGDLGLVAPMYFGQGDFLSGGSDFKPADARGYTTFDIGVSPSRENLSSEDQRKVYNRIQEILSQADKIAEAGEPYRAASMAADVEGYLADEKNALEERRGNLTDAQVEWAHHVAQAGKDYRKAKKKAVWGKVLGVVGGAVGAIVGAPIPGLSYYTAPAGYKIGEGLA